MITIKNRWNGAVIAELETLHGADLRGADLRGADLRGAGLRGADLREADLRGANLREADLNGADLRGAGLRGANLREANLREAGLRWADLRGADLHGAINAPIIIGGLRWTVQISGTGWMQIGCQKHSVAEWAGFDDERIGEMADGSLDFWRAHKPMLMALCEQWKHPEEKA